MDKTKEQLYSELKELTEEKRKQLKTVLDDIVESGTLSVHLVNIPKCLDLCTQYNIGLKELVKYLDKYLDMEINDLNKFCEYREVSVQQIDIENPYFYESLNITLCPQIENTFLGDLFCYVSFSYQQMLKDFIENYLEHGNAFTEYLCDNGFISADIYSDGFYDLITVKELSTIFTEQEKFFKNELEKLKSLQSSLYVCMYKLNAISRNFKHRFSGYLDYLGFERKH